MNFGVARGQGAPETGAEANPPPGATPRRA